MGFLKLPNLISKITPQHSRLSSSLTLLVSHQYTLFNLLTRTAGYLEKNYVYSCNWRTIYTTIRNCQLRRGRAKAVRATVRQSKRCLSVRKSIRTHICLDADVAPLTRNLSYNFWLFLSPSPSLSVSLSLFPSVSVSVFFESVCCL